MSRYLLAVMGALAMSACTNSNPNDADSRNSDSTPRNGMDDNRNASGSPQDRRDSTAGNTTQTTADSPSRTRPVDRPGTNDLGSERLQPTNPPAVAPTAADGGNRKGSTLTAGDQSENDADRRITQLVRQAVVADLALSMKAKNCTIITIGGIVTLRGSVDTAAERTSIGSKAEGISGVRRIENNLEITR